MEAETPWKAGKDLLKAVFETFHAWNTFSLKRPPYPPLPRPYQNSCKYQSKWKLTHVLWGNCPPSPSACRADEMETGPFLSKWHLSPPCPFSFQRPGQKEEREGWGTLRCGSTERAECHIFPQNCSIFLCVKVIFRWFLMPRKCLISHSLGRSHWHLCCSHLELLMDDYLLYLKAVWLHVLARTETHILNLNVYCLYKR